MRKVCLLSIPVVLFLVTALPVSIQAQDRDYRDEMIVRIGIVPDHPPFMMVDDQGQPTGFLVDLFSRLVSEFGYEPEFVVSDFYDLIERLLNNEIDIFPAVVWQPQREALFHWPEEPSVTGWGQLFIAKDGRLDDIYELQGKTVAVVRDEAAGSLFKEYMQTLGITVNIDIYDNADAMVNAVVSGQVFGGVAHNTLLLGRPQIRGTEVIFAPTRAYAATSASNYRMIPLVDQFSTRLRELRNDSVSYYWSLYTLWNASEAGLRVVLPDWFWFAAVGMLILVVLLVLFSWVLKLRVDRATTELKELNESLEDKVSRRTAELKEAADRLADSEKASITMRLVGGIAHEINTPIGVAVTAVSHMEREVETLARAYRDDNLTSEAFEHFLKESEEVLSMTSVNLKRSAELITNFRNVNSDQFQKQKRDIELDSYIRGIVKSVKPQFKNTGVKIHLNIKKGTVNTYPDVLIHILLNLLLNALTHGFQGRDKGDIYLSVIVKGGHVRIVHTDSGRGISDEAAQHIFEPFYTSNREKGNTGLGLSIVFNLVQDVLGGTISVKSRPDHFTKFTVEFDL